MNCPHCGRELSDRLSCPCGFVPPDQIPQNTNPVNPVVAAIRSLGRSRLLLWIFRLFTAACGLSLVNMIISIVAQQGVFDLSFLIPGIIALAIWRLRQACCDETPTIATNGLSLLRILCIVLTVIISIGLACSIFGLVISTTAPVSIYEEAWEELTANLPAGTLDSLYEEFSVFTQGAYFENFIRTLVTAMFVVAAGILTFVLVIYLFLLSGIKTLKENCNGYLSNRSFPMFLIVLWYIFAVCGWFSLVGAVLTLTFDVYTLQTAVTSTAWFLLAKLMHSYRKQMEYLRIYSLSHTQNNS